MPSDPDEVKAQLEALRLSYVRELPGRIRDVDLAFAGLEAAWERDKFVEFHRKIHAMAGSGAMFGYPALTDSARALDLLLKGLDPDRRPDPESVERIRRGLEAVRESAKT